MIPVALTRSTTEDASSPSALSSPAVESAAENDGSLASGGMAVFAFETMWLLASLTVHVVYNNPNGYFIACASLAAYCAVNWRTIRAVPLPVKFICASFVPAVFGGWNTGYWEDIGTPVISSLTALAVMGVFPVKFQQQRHVRMIAFMGLVLTPIAVWQSFVRNSSLRAIAVGIRSGINTQALYGWGGLCCAMFAPAKSVWIAIPWGCFIVLTGSRSALLGAVVVVLFWGLYGSTGRSRLRPWLLVISSFVGLYLFWTVQGYLISAFGPSNTFSQSVERLLGSEILITIQERNLITEGWIDFFLNNPTFFGHGLNSYGWRMLTYFYPHNGYLHMLNGSGVVGAGLYLAGFFIAVRQAVRTRMGMDYHGRLGFAVFVALAVRQFAEVSLFVQVSHIFGFTTCYFIGLGLAKLDSLNRSME